MTLKLDTGLAAIATNVMQTNVRRERITGKVQENADRWIERCVLVFAVPLCAINAGDTGSLGAKGEPPFAVKIISARKESSYMTVDALAERFV